MHTQGLAHARTCMRFTLTSIGDSHAKKAWGARMDFHTPTCMHTQRLACAHLGLHPHLTMLPITGRKDCFSRPETATSIVCLTQSLCASDTMTASVASSN